MGSVSNCIAFGMLAVTTAGVYYADQSLREMRWHDRLPPSPPVQIVAPAESARSAPPVPVDCAAATELRHQCAFDATTAAIGVPPGFSLCLDQNFGPDMAFRLQEFREQSWRDVEWGELRFSSVPISVRFVAAAGTRVNLTYWTDSRGCDGSAGAALIVARPDEDLIIVPNPDDEIIENPNANEDYRDERYGPYRHRGLWFRIVHFFGW